DTLSRFYFLDRLLNRLQDLLNRAEYLEEFGVMVSKERALRYQTDLARDYEDLYRAVSYLDIELMTAHLPHRNQAMMLIGPLGGPPPSPSIPVNDEWQRRLAEAYLNWAERKGYEFDLFILVPRTRAAPTESPNEFLRLTAGNFSDLLVHFAERPQISEIAIY